MDYRVCIIGAGTAGLGVAKQLLVHEKVPLSEIIIVDDSTGVGGLWNRDNRVFETVGVTSCVCSGSPVYDDLHTNLPKDSMAFSDFRYPIESVHYPSHTTVLSYLKAYAQKFVSTQCVQFNTSVRQVRKINDKWTVTCCVKDKDTASNNRTMSFTTKYVVVCTGHYRHPLIPFFKESSHVNSCIKRIHSSAFRHPSAFTQYKRILVVGSRSSAKDICLLLRKTGQNIYVTIRGGMENMSRGRQSFFRPVISQGARQRGELEFINHQTGEVTSRAVLRCGESYQQPSAGNNRHRDTEQGSVKDTIDLIIYATGYVNKYPFLEDSGLNDPFTISSPSDSDSDSSVSDDSHSDAGGDKTTDHWSTCTGEIPLLHRIVALADPTLMFTGTLNHLLSPGIVLEYQARYAAQLISGKIHLPYNFSSLLNAFIRAKTIASGEREKYSTTRKEKTILVGEERVDISEFFMDANLELSHNPLYCK